MAISLAFGVLFATVITLFLVPSLYLMQNDYLNFIGLGSKADECKDALPDATGPGPILIET
jgi:hypothetical protein